MIKTDHLIQARRSVSANWADKETTVSHVSMIKDYILLRGSINDCGESHSSRYTATHSS